MWQGFQRTMLGWDVIDRPSREEGLFREARAQR